MSTQYVSDLERGVVGIFDADAEKPLRGSRHIQRPHTFGQAQGGSMPALTDKCRVLSRHSRPCSPTLLTASYRQSFQSVKKAETVTEYQTVKKYFASPAENLNFQKVQIFSYWT